MITTAMSYQLSIEEDSDVTNLFDQSPAHASHGEGALNAFNMNLTRGKGQEASNRLRNAQFQSSRGDKFNTCIMSCQMGHTNRKESSKSFGKEDAI
jgi:hypothetical protein